MVPLSHVSSFFSVSGCGITGSFPQFIFYDSLYYRVMLIFCVLKWLYGEIPTFPGATHLPPAAGGAVFSREDPPRYHRQSAAATASLCCGGRCSQSGRWRLFGGCRGTSGADTGGGRRGKIHTQSPQKTSSKTTVLIMLQQLRSEIDNISEGNPARVSDIRGANAVSLCSS